MSSAVLRANNAATIHWRFAGRTDKSYVMFYRRPKDASYSLKVVFLYILKI
jgi:hypothetical protein